MRPEHEKIPSIINHLQNRHIQHISAYLWVLQYDHTWTYVDELKKLSCPRGIIKKKYNIYVEFESLQCVSYLTK